MRLVVEISQDMYAKIEELIAEGHFKDPSQFLRVAVGNQLLAESGVSAWNVVETKEPVEAARVSSREETGSIEKLHLLLSLPHDSACLEADPKMAASQLLWGQYYRYLPAKVGLRALANACRDSAVPIETFAEEATELAVRFRMQLAQYDRKSGAPVGRRLATSFPSSDRNSQRRYAAQFLVSLRPKMRKLDGMLACMLFAGVRFEKDVAYVAPSQEGLEFAKLLNPVIDGDFQEGPLSAEERRYLLDHAAKRLPREAEHMRRILRDLKSEPLTVPSLSAKMTPWYHKVEPAAEWSRGKVNTMVAGATSRMIELGLLARQEDKKGSPLVLTAEGRRWEAGAS